MKMSKRTMKVWVVEDDQIYRSVLCEGLRQSMPGVVINVFPTEARVYAEVEKLERERGEATLPDVVIADVMLPYAFPGESAPEPSTEIIGEGEDAFRNAGIRLWRYAHIRSDSLLKKVPWIYHTVLRRQSMKFDENKDENTFYVGKDEPFADLESLSKVIFQQIDKQWEASDEEETSYLSRAPRMRDRLIAAMAVPLKQCVTVLK